MYITYGYMLYIKSDIYHNYYCNYEERNLGQSQCDTCEM